ncbi:hypothetical protein J41TS4_38020 [Paenibacillus apis]|uniref:Uncharacterized protein n=1 Tax=Paenibacillus apis TaxID=1792174 RepID=A0A919Y410_9BACL|nr:hypothetical protein J41TS4_38020 [Paenibacillus apis]
MVLQCKLEGRVTILFPLIREPKCKRPTDFAIRRTLASILGRNGHKLVPGKAACIFSFPPSHTTDVFPIQSKGVLNNA